MTFIDNGLSVGNVMDGGHGAVPDAQPCVHDFDHRRQTVGGTGCGGDDPVPVGIVLIMVYAVDNVQRGLRKRRRNQHLLYALVEVRLQRRLALEFAGTIQEQIDAPAAPIHIAWPVKTRIANAPAIDNQAIRIRLHLMLPATVHRIELQQMRHTECVAADLVDVNDLIIRRLPARAQAEPAHTSEAVNPDANSH